ncbi:Ubiquinone/menaquinone biosynthesis C-methylase UbiE [Roseivivax lentus]|uniref:Ubiquinone/menaquinone biosynthesis C-methylase UbiE n=1 Tax=Roseivivax lentus TaxID=633194 RepID=A0A1N7KEZ8_9RHOB|nr:methyltransferase domain-containing protein [Roseivivax lentus]SIS60178.1 Ubiquinone/menaquinone biosynthesis C-methylase UbiE [Roseivivax lentus]
MTRPANAEQEAFWSGDAGQRWVAHHRDLDILHDAVRARIMAAAAPQEGARILDVGCGGGALTLSAARAVGPDGAAHGVDISQPLLTLAAEAGLAAELGQARFFHADAQTHAFEAGYDLVLSRFGVMFFADPAAAFANLRAALRPGGRLVAATWAAAEHNPWFSTPRAAAVARLGAPPSSDPDAPGPMALREPARIRAILEAAGFDDISVTPEDIRLHHPDGWEAAQRLLPAIGPIPGVIRDREGGPDDLRAILEDMRARWAPHLHADGLFLPARINLMTARA